jgi:hypothetical protein
MMPTKEYLDQIAKRLEKLNPGITPESVRDSKKSPNNGVTDWLGASALNYLKNKKDPGIEPDPLFPDRNTY